MFLVSFTYLCVAIGLTGCGKPGDQPAKSTAITTQPNDPKSIGYLLVASIDEPGDVQNNASITIDKNVILAVPNYLIIQANGSQPGRATLLLGSKQITYKYDTDPQLGNVYRFLDCNGCVSGQQLSLTSGTALTLSIQPGYVTQRTVIQANLQGVIQ